MAHRRHRSRGTQFLVVCATGLVIAGGLAAYAFSSTDHKSTDPLLADQSAVGNMTMADAQAFTRYPLYNAGQSVAGLPSSGVNQSVGPSQDGELTGTDYVDFFYGVCAPTSSDPGCSAPVDVQVWNVCARWRDLVSLTPDQSVTVRGVPARFFEGFTRLELYTPDATIVIFGGNAAQLLSVANAISGVNALGIQTMTANGNLPPAGAAALAGTLSCQPH